MFHATGTLYKAAGVLLEGHPNEALPLLMQGLEAYRATGAGLALPYYLSILGDAYIQAGRPDDARDVLDEGLAIAERSDELCQKAELYRLKGELALRTGSQNGDAEVHFRRAIGTAQHQLSKAWELRATTSLARLCQQQGRRDEARQMLNPHIRSVHRGFRPLTSRPLSRFWMTWARCQFDLPVGIRLLWVINGQRGVDWGCPLSPKERTCSEPPQSANNRPY